MKATSGVTEPVGSVTSPATVSWDEARSLAAASVSPLAPRRVALADSLGTRMLEPLRALCSLPATHQSAMDGYAVAGAGPWLVVGHAPVGAPQELALSRGQACSIVTGAALPAGTDSVIADEDAVREGDVVSGRAPAGRHIRRAGEQCVASEVLVEAGVLVRPALVGLAAAAGHDAIVVRPRPQVHALVTGDELISAGVPTLGRVRDAIGPMIPGLVVDAGGTLTQLERIPDDHDALAAAFDAASADVILVSGSSAAGPADHLLPVLAALGAEVILAGVSCRPGHPQTLARLTDGRLVVGLPGNPLAALAAFMTLAVPVLAGLNGDPVGALPTMTARGIVAHPYATRLVPVRIRDGMATPVAHAGAAMLRGVATADAVAIVDPASQSAQVRVLALGAR